MIRILRRIIIALKVRLVSNGDRQVGIENQVQNGFPPAFSPSLYRKLNPDLTQLDDRELTEHWHSRGIEEGRRSYPFTNRQELAAFVDHDLEILEISPFTAPFFYGPNVTYADVLDNDSLAIRAKEQGLVSTGLPVIEFVISPNRLSDRITRKFDLVASSHVVEHQPNFVGHLREVSKILKEGGCYVVVIPDKRYCFDHFFSESNIADIIQANYQDKAVHSLNSVIEHHALTTHNDAVRHWAGDHGSPKHEISKIQEAMDLFSNAQGSYIDVHAWYFTPSSFSQAIDLTLKLGLQPFSIDVLYPTNKNNLEFYAVLKLSN